MQNCMPVTFQMAKQQQDARRGLKLWDQSHLHQKERVHLVDEAGVDHLEVASHVDEEEEDKDSIVLGQWKFYK